MRLVKIKKKIYKREILGFRLTVVVFDITEIDKAEHMDEITHSKVFYVIPQRAEDPEIKMMT